MRVFPAILCVVVLSAVGLATAADREPVSPEPVKRPVAREISITEPPPSVGSMTPASPSADDLEVKWSVIGGGGKTVEAGTLRISGTIGQTSAGWTSGLKHDVHAGFWQNFGYTPCCEHRGNVDHKFTNASPIAIPDLTYLVAMVWRAGPDAPCKVEADVTGDGSINVLDVTFLVSFLFKAGPAPGPC